MTDDFPMKIAALTQESRGKKLSTQTLIFLLCGCMLVSAIIIAVGLIVSSRAAGPEPQGNIIAPMPSPDPETVIVEPPAPTSTPTPVPESVKVFFFEDEKEEFTQTVGESVTLKAVAYPVDQFPNATFKWSVNDESVIKLTVSEDTKECEVLCLKTQPGGVTLTVECNGVTRQVKIYTKN